MPAVSEKQKKAMFAAAAGKSTLGIPAAVGKEFVGASDQKIKGAGIMLITPQDEVLFLLRSPDANHPDEWDFPGGRADENETPEQTARRETHEEIGATPYGQLEKIADTESKDDSGSDVDFITFKQHIMHKFTPKIDKSEHTKFVWATLDNPPEPLHPGVREVVDRVLGKKIAKDATQHWISTEKGSHILLNGEGEVIGGAAGKLNGNKFSPKSKSKDVTKFLGYTPSKTESTNIESKFDPNTAFNNLETSPFNGNLSEEQRNKIAKSEKLFQKYGEVGKEGARSRFKEAARSGKLDNLYAEHEQNEKDIAAAQKAEKKEKNAKQSEKYRQKALNKIEAEAHEKAEKINAYKNFEKARQEKYEAEAKTPFTKPIDHETLVEPKKIIKETDNAYGIQNPAWKEVQELLNHGGGMEVMRRGSPQAREAYQNKEELIFVPKSQSQAHGGEIKSIQPWMADKLGIETSEGPTRKATASKARHYLNVPYAEKDKAKAMGAKWDADKKKWYHPTGEMPEGLKKYSAQSSLPSSASQMPTTGRIHEDDPSIWGSELLGHEGERWEDFHSRNVPKTSPASQADVEYDSALGKDETFDCGYTQDQIAIMDKENSQYAMDSMPTVDGMAFDRSSVSIVPVEMAMDFKSVRTIDQDGRMHISEANITMEQVAPYYGSEIPDYESLGLIADEVYQVYRPADELEKAVSTFNLIPLLSEHVPINSKKPEKELVCGSTGSEAVWSAPYIKNSLVVTVAEDVEGIEKNRKRELSAGYYYKPVKENGVFEGQPYQIRMTEIVANHLALVERGRCGPQVVVGDSSKVVSTNLNGVSNMSDIALSKKATKAKGALLAVLKPIMATDAQATIGAKLDTILAGVKRKNWLEKKPGIVAAIKPLLAKDADIKEVVELLDKLDSAKPDDDNLGQDDMDPKCEAIIAKLRGKLSDEDLAEIEAMMKAKPVGDEPPQTANAANANPKDQTNKEEMGKDDENDMMNQEDMTAAMDAAIKKAAKETEVKTIARMNAIAEAKEIVKPIVGTLAITCDSAEDVFKATLKLKGINTAGIDSSAYKAMVMMLPKESARAKEHIAQDSASGALPNDILEAFPHMQRVSH